MKNKGLEAENELINSINGKYFSELSSTLKKFVSELYKKEIDYLKKFMCHKYFANYKPDIVITHNNIQKYISIKTGKNCSIHQEHLYSFLMFLSDNGCDNYLIKKLKNFILMIVPQTDQVQAQKEKIQWIF